MKLLKAHLKGQPLFFTTWYLKIFYWALKAPLVRFATISSAGVLQVWELDCVPFGWDKACFLGQTTHLQVVNQVPKPQDTDAQAYIDDGLGCGPDQQQLTDYTQQVPIPWLKLASLFQRRAI